MMKDIIWAEDRDYKTGSEDEPLQFYLDALCNSKSFDLLLGYFSSSALNILSLGFANFIYSGGKMRIIINNVLSVQDKEAIERGQRNKEVFVHDFNNLYTLKTALDDYGIHFFECFAWLIANDRIEFKIIKPKDKKGIAHYKSGIFSDGKDMVGFKSSCNFTAYGLLENLEELECFLSWDDERSTKFIKKQNRYFNEIFYEQASFVEYLDITNVKESILDIFGNKNISELLIQGKELMEKKKIAFQNAKIQKSIVTAQAQTEKYDKLETYPKFPYSEGPRAYQIEAYEKWIANGKKGLFNMATGTGKTITSLNCILNDYLTFNHYKFIVLVPTTALAKQWEEEIKVKFNFQNIFLCCSINSLWKEDLKDLGKNIVFGIGSNYAIVTTYATFKGKNFQGIFRDLFQTEFNKITIIADEAHTLGSPGFLKVLPTYINKRIGLSATPERQFDDEGNTKLIEFFDTTTEGYTYEYNMKTAIENEVLCRYYYYPIIVDLEQDEQEEYLKITNELVKHIDQETGKYKESDFVSMLLIKRKNVIHKANRKINAIINIVAEIGVENFKKAFIYVPEGITVDYVNNDDFDVNQENDNKKLIDIYLKKLFENYSLRMAKFTGETRNREQILDQFKDGKLDALLAMKCLDEGVDVPQTKYAIFCSSTGNPRQYVQRRGRVLRKHKEKDFAIIYDLIVKPITDHTDTNEKLSALEKNIFLSELRRLVNFAVLSENKDSCLADLETLCYDLDIDIYDLANKELENYK